VHHCIRTFAREQCANGIATMQDRACSRIKQARARLCTDHDAVITGARGSLQVLCRRCFHRTGNGERETMMRPSRETAVCLLTHAHALPLRESHRARAVATPASWASGL
jgi:hypothetical protein